ncbi:hypothetical protein M406DRAFT_333804 [Cryphonectria parasitica EP155]|uniref:Uncharacterized protein n=1 Tax=Cryphonectria parasitica (strain ATCC 38755 / EP155) TaxID=660469 RepID=A0A9P4XUX8_CRYP1|nr:uncharacterized protein M406DRAFT_333804 [Cryphonectria parasitica EP155]KAF3761752.1 hypothetical protein M406DRAFT_333804 [Cryphonectria parasitica EP155]
MASVKEVQSRLVDAVADIKERVHTKLGAEGADKDEALLDFAEAVAKQTTSLMHKSTAESGGSIFAIRKAFRSESRSLAYYLGMTSERNYTMAHDRFYALYGIMPAAQSVSPVDYDKPLRQVVLELTSYVINVEHNINLYFSFGLRPNHLSDNNEEFPSWIPDFSRGSDLHNPDRYITDERVVRRLCHNAFEGAPQPVVDDLITLRTNGFAAGTVTQTSTLPTTQQGIFAELQALLSGSTYAAASAAGQLGAESTLAERWAAAASSRMGQWLGEAVGRDQVNSNIVQTVESIHSQFAAGGRPHCTLPWTPLRLEREFAGLAGRTTFITDSGLLGLGVAQIEKGDVVAILHKENVAILLRPVTQRAGEQGGEATCYKMVGTAYVSGLIDNEWLDEGLVVSISKKTPSAFIII